MFRRKKLTAGGIAFAIFLQFLQMILREADSRPPSYRLRANYPTSSIYHEIRQTGTAISLTMDAITGKSNERNWGRSTPFFFTTATRRPQNTRIAPTRTTRTPLVSATPSATPTPRPQAQNPNRSGLSPTPDTGGD